MPDTKSFDALLGEAQALVEAGRHAEALPLFDRALALDPESAYAWFCRGCACSALAQPAEAARCYLESTRRKADNPAAWFNLGSALQASASRKRRSIASAWWCNSLPTSRTRGSTRAGCSTTAATMPRRSRATTKR